MFESSSSWRASGWLEAVLGDGACGPEWVVQVEGGGRSPGLLDERLVVPDPNPGNLPESSRPTAVTLQPLEKHQDALGQMDSGVRKRNEGMAGR